MRLSMRWTPEHQVMIADGVKYEHFKRPYTTASHDLCHLVAAAHGNMPWYPEGYMGPANEFNAIQLQQIYMVTYLQIASGGKPNMKAMLDRWEWHAHFYAVTHSEKYSIDYPISLEESRRRFLRALDAELVARLWPIYVDVYAAEQDKDHPPIVVEFTDQSIAETDERGELGRTLIQELIAALKARHLSVAESGETWPSNVDSRLSLAELATRVRAVIEAASVPRVRPELVNRLDALPPRARLWFGRTGNRVPSDDYCRRMAAVILRDIGAVPA